MLQFQPAECFCCASLPVRIQVRSSFSHLDFLVLLIVSESRYLLSWFFCYRRVHFPIGCCNLLPGLFLLYLPYLPCGKFFWGSFVTGNKRIFSPLIYCPSSLLQLVSFTFVISLLLFTLVWHLAFGWCSRSQCLVHSFLRYWKSWLLTHPNCMDIFLFNFDYHLRLTIRRVILDFDLCILYLFLNLSWLIP